MSSHTSQTQSSTSPGIHELELVAEDNTSVRIAQGSKCTLRQARISRGTHFLVLWISFLVHILSALYLRPIYLHLSHFHRKVAGLACRITDNFNDFGLEAPIDRLGRLRVELAPGSDYKYAVLRPGVMLSSGQNAELFMSSSALVQGRTGGNT